MKVEYVNHMGDDLSVVNAARVSFDKVSDWIYSEVDTNGPPERDLRKEDKKLIGYLARGCSHSEWWDLVDEIYNAAEIGDGTFGSYISWNERQVEDIVKTLSGMHTHWTPFTHTAITLRMQAPVPIRTQCFRHRQGFTENEESRRYVSSTPSLFVPDHFRSKAENVKQGSAGIHPRSGYHRDAYDYITSRCVAIYEEMIEDGVCPEQARLVLPQGVMVNWIWTGNLASYARFYNQRTDPHAQKEIQDLAKAVGEIIQPMYPVSWMALTKGD
jgi:thymidylate synthase (FAD)